MDDNTLNALRAALAVSPDNVPLRAHLAETLLATARYAEAAENSRWREPPELTGLKKTQAPQGRQSHASGGLRRCVDAFAAPHGLLGIPGLRARPCVTDDSLLGPRCVPSQPKLCYPLRFRFRDRGANGGGAFVCQIGQHGFNRCGSQQQALRVE
jgi:hypothetical protein